MKRPVLVILLSLAMCGSTPFAQSAGSYAPLKEIPIGGAGGGDYLSIDPEAHRLYVSHSTRVVATHRLFVGCSNKLMLMLDSTNGKLVATVPTGDGVDATWFDPGTKLAFSSAREGTVTIASVAPDTMKTVQTLKTFPGARTMALDPRTHKIYLSTATYAPAAPGATGVNGAAARPQPVPESFRVLVFGPQK